jgi:hypothetical protein
MEEKGQSRDVLIKGVEQVFDPEEIQVLVEGSTALGRTAPPLSESDIARIAEQVAAKVVAEFGSDIPLRDQPRWEKQIAKLARELAVGVAASALYELLGYLLHHVLYLDDDSAELNSRRSRRNGALSRLIERIPAGHRDEFEALTAFPPLTSLMGSEIQKAASAGPGMVELEQEIIRERERKYGPGATTGKNRIAAAVTHQLLRQLQCEAGIGIGEPEVT